MTHNDDFIGRLENYLDEYEGVTPLPDAVRDAIRAELPKTKQIGPLAGLSRFLSMTLQLPATARYGLAAAGVVAAIFIGANFLGGGGSVGGPDASASQQPSASQLPEPTATGPMNLVEAPEGGDLPAGDYYLDLPAYPARIDFEVPEGWWHYYDGPVREDATVHAILVNNGVDGGYTSAWGLSFALVDEVRVDPCDRNSGSMDPSVTESAESLADAFSSWEDFPATSVEDVTLGGFTGKRVEITRDGSVECTIALFSTPSGYNFGPEFPSTRPIVNQFTFLDVEGSVLVVWTTDFPGSTEFEEAAGAPRDREAHAEDQPQLHDILESILIQPR